MRFFIATGDGERWVAYTGRVVELRRCLVRARESPREEGETRANGFAITS